MLGSGGLGPAMQISVLDAPFYMWRRVQRHGDASDVNERITRYVGVGLYDDLTCEPDRGAYISVESGQYFQVFMILERTPPTPS